MKDSELRLQAGRLTVEFLNSVAGFPAGLSLADHQDGGYAVEGAEGFTAYLGSPLNCDSMKDFLGKSAIVVDDYQAHLWQIIQKAG